MTAQETFDRRLGDALLAYASDATMEPDPMQFAAEIAAAHPRRRFALLRPRLSRTELRQLWLVVVMLLLVGAVGAAAVGMRLFEPRPLSVDPAKPVPAALFGRWVADGGTGAYIDLNSTWLVHEADGQALTSMGSVVAFLPAGREGIEGRLLIRSTLPCGDASYRLIPDDTPSEGPTAAPAPPATLQSGPTFFDRIRFVDAVDPCLARRSILASQPWSRLRITLRAGGTFDSLDFGEPFHMALPADAAGGLFSDEVGTVYQLVPGQLRISHAWWNGAFIDDVPVYRDLCNHDLGTLPDIPASVEAVGAWLAATTAPGVRVGGPMELVIDGRRATRWQIEGECSAAIPAASDLAYGFDYYAIPTGDDVILFVVRADTANESNVAERIALAMHFD